jgi:hypothetical protein
VIKILNIKILKYIKLITVNPKFLILMVLKVLKISHSRCCRCLKLYGSCIQTSASIVYKYLVLAERIMCLVWSPHHFIRYTVVGAVTRPLTGQPRNRGWIPSMSKRLLSSPDGPDRLCSLPSILLNGYRGRVPRDKAAGAWSWPFTLFRNEVKMNGTIFPVLHTPSWRSLG